MQTLLRTFLDRLAARIVPLVTSLVAVRLEASRSLLVAEDQAELEEAARRYESMGMPQVAAGLRGRIGELAGDDPCRAGARLADNLGAQPALPDNRPPDLARIGESESTGVRRSRQARKPAEAPTVDDLDL